MNRIYMCRKRLALQFNTSTHQHNAHTTATLIHSYMARQLETTNRYLCDMTKGLVQFSLVQLRDLIRIERKREKKKKKLL